MKGQVLHCERAFLKVPGCSLVLSALLTKKLPRFLSHLDEKVEVPKRIYQCRDHFGVI